ncbi:hypothetical protein B0E41_19310 [Hydrogenophaga sp. A37]|nr:hypothetical protein B0E41_19310 [Hydrogenophaga sp. A37]
MVAAWVAARMGAPLEFLHVIHRHPALQGHQDHSVAIGANAEENLLKNLSEQDAAPPRAGPARRFGHVEMVASSPMYRGLPVHLLTIPMHRPYAGRKTTELLRAARVPTLLLR